jgi:predicted enzyme related to lactoylglutathione lyase
MSENHGAIWWSELLTRDVAAAKAYYATVCGWTFDEMPMGDTTYNVAKMGEKMVAGIMDIGAAEGMEDLPPLWITYLAVDDVDHAAEQTGAGGGEVVRAPWEIPGIGRIAMLKDPSGAIVGIMKPA